MNTISQVNQQNIFAVNRVNNVPQKYRVSYGTQISFGSSKSERALKLLDKTIDTLVEGSEYNIANKMRFHKVLSEALPAILQPENFINKGRESKVYRISDKYVAKVKRGHYAGDSIHFYNTVSLPNNKFKDIDFYYGEPVAKVGQVEILKNALPTDNHVYCGAPFHYNSLISPAEMKQYETKFLPMCNDVPQESFDNLARNLKQLNRKTTRSLTGKKETYVPDIVNPNNLLISDGRFVLVDKLEKVPFENPNSVYTMLEPLLLRLNPETTARPNVDLLDMRTNIFKKVLVAAEKHELPLDSPIKYEFSEWTLGDILGNRDILSDVKSMRDRDIPLTERIRVIEQRLSKKS